MGSVPADWDFNFATWSLDPTLYVSAPSSIKIPGRDGAPWGTVALCKKAAALCLPQGRLVSSVQFSSPAQTQMYFRNQQPSGSASTSNTYNCLGYPGGFVFRRVVNNVETDLPGWDAAWFKKDVWHLLRLTWWVAYNYQNTKSLAMRLERWVDDGWNIEHTYYDPQNRWEASEVNRVGVGCRWPSYAYAWFDDTEIWVPAT